MIAKGNVVAAQGICLADFTNEALMVPRLQARDVPGVIRELSEALQRESCVPVLLPFYHAVLNREFLGSSAMGCGMALPHARLDGLRQLWFALGRSVEPLVWGPKDALPVDLIFLIAVPTHDVTGYLRLISGVARLGKESQLLTNLRAADTPVAMFSALEQVKLHSSGNADSRAVDRREAGAP